MSCSTSCARRPVGPRGAARSGHLRDQAAATAPPRRPGPVVYDCTRRRPHPARGRRGMSAVETRDWAGVLTRHAVEPETGRRLVGQLRACEVSALAFCRLLERWARGDAEPSSPGRREQRCSARPTGPRLRSPVWKRLWHATCSSSSLTSRRRWYGEPGQAELVAWDDVLTRAGVHAAPHRVAQAYLELAVLVRARGARRSGTGRMPPDRNLVGGLFDLRENLLDRAVEDLRALAA